MPHDGTLATARRLVARTVRERRVPRHVWQWLRLQLSTAARALAARWFAPAWNPSRRRAARAHEAELTAAPDRTLLRHNGRWEVARTFRASSVASASDDVLRVVAATLQRAGVAGSMTRRWRGGSMIEVDRSDTSATDRALSDLRRRGELTVLVEETGSHGGRAWVAYAVEVAAGQVIADRSTSECRVVPVGQSERAPLEPASLPPPVDAVGFPIDVVYTWVDDRDPAWNAQLARTIAEANGVLHPLAANPSRYRNRDELRFSMRSLALHAPWVRRVFLVTAGQVPEWLACEHVTVVDHTEIIDLACLPTFNSHAIEAHLHRIDGLAEHYVYMNDDVLLTAPLAPTQLFTADGRSRYFPDATAVVAEGQVRPDDSPIDAATKNVRSLLHDRPVRIDRKMHHAPHPQQRSVLFEIEAAFPAEVARTRSSRLRAPTDLNVATALHHWYAASQGRAVEGELAVEYVNVASRWARLQLRRVLQDRDRDVVCLNETGVRAGSEAQVDRLVTRFSNAALPVRSRFERTGP
jgi:hypothetical protein